MPARIANANLIEDTMEIAGAVLIIAVLIGQIDLPLFYAVSTTGWGTPNIVLWGVINVVAFAVLIMLIVQKMKYYTTT
jgi:ABC-type transporter Mla maintaining outer membrane lipid asymmetry permease subunit MlaE